MEDQPQGRASDLTALAEAKFGKLSHAEKLLLEKVPSGDFAICGPKRDRADSNPTKEDDDDPRNNPGGPDKWGEARKIRADLVAWLCTDQEAREHVHWRGIQVYGADVTGPVNLSFVNIPFQLALQHCRLKEAINLRWAELSQLDLEGSLVYGILAAGVIVKNDVLLSEGFSAVGEVQLLGAQIGGDLDCSGGAFTNPPRNIAGSGNALHADRIKVKSSIFLRASTVNGEVRLLAAQIGGNLECDAATFTNPLQKDLAGSGTALNASSITVVGSVFLRHGAAVDGKDTPFIARGQVNAIQAEVGGQFDCSGGDFSNSEQAGVENSRKVLWAPRITVKSAVFLEDGFTANGVVDLYGANIGGPFSCRNGNFQNATLNLTNASAGSLTDSGLNNVPAGAVADEGPTIWPQQDKLLLDGFVYGRISSEGGINVKERLKWLGRQTRAPFRRQPYLHLAKVLRESGDSNGARQVLEKMEELRRSGEKPVGGRSSKWLAKIIDLARIRMARLWSLFLKVSIGYGYYPGRAIRLIILLSVVGWIVYGASYDARTMVPTDKDAYKEFKDPKTERQVPPHYPTFSSPVYSLENSLPLVKLGQGDKWQPDPEPDGWSPVLVRWFLRLQILLGWLLATLFVAGVSGVVHKE